MYCDGIKRYIMHSGIQLSVLLFIYSSCAQQDVQNLNWIISHNKIEDAVFIDVCFTVSEHEPDT